MRLESGRRERTDEALAVGAPAGSRLHWRTDFSRESERDFFVEPTRINSAVPGSRLKHQQAASITRLRSGELLVTCRWDERGDSEGDSSNEQALYFSRDGGGSWRMANGGDPIVTLAQGTSFAVASAITHSFVHEDSAARPWLYYTINQPHTWGEGRPDRSTGGGEIRRVPLRKGEDGDWQAGASEIVWAFMSEITDGAGGTWGDVRALCLNGIVRLRSGRLLMPIAGRSTVPDPRGAFWPLDRSWVLSSDDDGDSWTSRFMGGGPSLAVCEPTLVEAASDDHVVAYLRSQYDTGFELYRSESRDGGHTWSPPVAAGLPNTRGSGAKPFLTKLTPGHYALLQTNEHDRTDRTNVSVFITDEEGFIRNSWRLVKVLSAECREHWLGSAYGWMTEDPRGGIHAVWVSFVGQENHLNYANLGFDWLTGTVIEPLAPADASGNDLPRVGVAEGKARGLTFPALRSRAHAPHLGALEGSPYRVSLEYRIGRLAGEFTLLDLRALHGRHPWIRIELRSSESAANDKANDAATEPTQPISHKHQVWINANGGAFDSGVRVGEALRLEAEVLSPREARLIINDKDLGRFHSVTARHPTTLYVGGNTVSRRRCEIVLLRASYGTTESGAGRDGQGELAPAHLDHARKHPG